MCLGIKSYFFLLLNPKPNYLLSHILLFPTATPASLIFSLFHLLSPCNPTNPSSSPLSMQPNKPLSPLSRSLSSHYRTQPATIIIFFLSSPFTAPPNLLLRLSLLLQHRQPPHPGRPSPSCSAEHHRLSFVLSPDLPTLVA